MKKHQIYFYLFIAGFELIKPDYCFAQKEGLVSSGYYLTYPDKVMGRIYLAQKYAPFTVSSNNNSDNELNYKTNSKLGLGIGVTYRSLTLNLAYGFSFLNKDKGQGKTKGLDLQLHLYPNRWAIDLLGTFRKGYYLDPKDNSGLTLFKYYQRPDVKREIVGFSVFRVPNSNKFSYQAALTQIDWQKKSAGSLLFGGEVYYGNIKGDSALVPINVSSIYSQAGITKVNFFSIGPGVGYAYTFVISKHFFITGSGIANLNVDFSTEEKVSNKNNTVALTPDFVYKGAFGYNSATWSVSANIIGNALYVGSAASSKEYFLPTGTLRFIIAKKF